MTRVFWLFNLTSRISFAAGRAERASGPKALYRAGKGRRAISLSDKSLTLRAFQIGVGFGAWDRIAMARAKILVKSERCPKGIRALAPMRRHARTSHHTQSDRRSGASPEAAGLSGCHGTLWLKRCLSMPPTRKRHGWLWSTETRSRNSTLKPSTNASWLAISIWQRLPG